MSNTNKLVILIAIILIIVCVVAGGKTANKETGIIDSQKEQSTKEITYNTVKNEITGLDEYVVYDKETGEEITRVEEEHQLKIYEIDPNYEELPVESEEEQLHEESIIE